MVSKSEPKESNKNRKGAKGRQKRTNREPKQAQRGQSEQNLLKIKPWRVFYFFVRQNGKNDHGALVGLMRIKGTSLKNFFLL